MAILGILTAWAGITPTTILTAGTNNRIIALSATLIWIFLGGVLAYRSLRPLHRIAGLVVQVVLALIVAFAAIEFILSVGGSHLFVETLLVEWGKTILGPASNPISPVAAGLAVPAAFALLLAIREPGAGQKSSWAPDAVCLLGGLISIVSFTFVISYVYGNPLLYGTQYIPIAFSSALAIVCTGIGLVFSAGIRAFPLRYFVEDSTRAGLLRVFVPLVVVMILMENIVMVSLSSWVGVRDAILLSLILVVFALATVLVIVRVSGRMGNALDRAEQELVRKNEDLNAMNEELTATQEELRQNVDDLGRSEEGLLQNEERLKAALAEKEILLSEIHHRVKNNLTAFISLLNLEGTTEETPAGRELKKDLQNRARSMALIHETLYRTHQFSEVDMDAYLTPLVDQIVNSYASLQPIRTIVEAKGVSLDLARATPAGLIVNELVTNSFKHGFPKDVLACRADQKDPCTIGVRLTKNDETYVLSVWDNGVGMPVGFDPLTAKSLGLKLVNFLAKHQMRATIEVNIANGTEFVFRFKARDHGA